MAHDIKFKIPERELGKSDIEFIVREDDEILGTLKISKGSVDWYRRNGKKPYKELTWKKFVDIIENN